MKNGDEIDRLKYSVMVITALSTFVYLLYNYVQNKPVNENFYALAIVLISSAIIYIMILILYIFFKGFANEIQNLYFKKIINKFVPLIYKNSFLITIILFFYSILFYYFLTTYFNDQEINYDITNLLFYIVIISTYILHNILMINIDNLEFFFIKKNIKTPIPLIELNRDRYFKNKFDKFKNALIRVFNKIGNKLSSLNQNNPKIFNFLLRSFNAESFFFIFISTIYLLFIYLFTFIAIMALMPGDVQIDIANIHNKNDTQIPVLIQVSGPNTGLSIELFKEQSNNLSRIAYIDYLEPQHTLKTSSNNSLFGHTLDIGKYSVFINTTNLTTGYYELKCVRPEFGGTHESFYLLESN